MPIARLSQNYGISTLSGTTLVQIDSPRSTFVVNRTTLRKDIRGLLKVRDRSSWRIRDGVDLAINCRATGASCRNCGKHTEHHRVIRVSSEQARLTVEFRGVSPSEQLVRGGLDI